VNTDTSLLIRLGGARNVAAAQVNPFATQVLT